MKLASFECIVTALNAARVRYLVVGGLAVNAHGYGRSTFDVDLVIDLVPDNILQAFATLAEIGYQPCVPITAQQFADTSLREQWRAENGMVVLKFWSDMHLETPLDVFAYLPFDFQVEWNMAFWQELEPGLQVPIIRLAALEQMKREAGRPKDLADIDELKLIHNQPSSYDKPTRSPD
jgi:hypothetical protein